MASSRARDPEEHAGQGTAAPQRTAAHAHVGPSLSGTPDATAATQPDPAAASADTWAALHGLCDGVPGPDAAERGEHVARLQAALRASGLDAFVAEPGPTMLHLSGVRWGLSERPFLLLVPAEGAPRFVCPAFEDGTARERVGAETPLWTWREHESPGAVAAQALARPGARARAGGLRVAVDPPLRSFVREDLDAGLGRATVLGAAIVADVRGRKQPAELARLRAANVATKAAIAAVAPRLRVGLRESQARALIVEAQRAAGLSDPWALVLFGPNAAFPHGTGQERALAAEDAVLIDTGGALHGYWSDVSRTLLPPMPAAALRRAYDAVAAAQAAGIAAVREGVACGAIDAAARDVIAAAGLGAPDAVFRHRTGHGIGLEVHEAPYLVRGSRVALARGHTFSVEPGIYLPGQLGVRIEDIVAVGPSGPEILGPAQSPGAPPPTWGSEPAR